MNSRWVNGGSCKKLQPLFKDALDFQGPPISNGNRTKWSPIRSVVIRVINKIGRPRRHDAHCPIKLSI